MVAVFSGSEVKALLAEPHGQLWLGSCVKFSILNRLSGMGVLRIVLGFLRVFFNH